MYNIHYLAKLWGKEYMDHWPPTHYLKGTRVSGRIMLIKFHFITTTTTTIDLLNYLKWFVHIYWNPDTLT